MVVSWLFVVFVVVPLTELYLLVVLSHVIGFWTTLTLALATGLVGASLARREGLRVWRAWQDAMTRMVVPEDGVVEGLLVLFGGTLLITPGVLTDGVGLLLLVPSSRRAVAKLVRRAIDRRIEAGRIEVVTWGHTSSVPGDRRWGMEGSRSVIETSGVSAETDDVQPPRRGGTTGPTGESAGAPPRLGARRFTAAD